MLQILAISEEREGYEIFLCLSVGSVSQKSFRCVISLEGVCCNLENGPQNYSTVSTFRL